MVEFPIHFNHIESCTQLKAHQKDAFVDACALAGPNKDDIRAAAEQYFRDNKMLGNPVDLPDDASLGRLHMWTALANLFAGSPDVTADRRGPLKDLQDRYSTGNPGVRARVIEEVLDRFADQSVAYIVWAFVFRRRQMPFSAAHMPKLPCRLGLEEIEHDCYFPLVFPEPSCEIRCPTAFDPGMKLLPYWRPGGKSWPREKCKSSTGFQEVLMPGSARTPWPDGLRFSDAKPPPAADMAGTS